MIIAVMPAYNEEKTITDTIERSLKHVDKIIVVNDASIDNTASLAKKAGALVLTHEKNQGLGASLRTGFSKAISLKPDIILTIDADGQHDPEEIPKFLEMIDKGYGFVLGKRNLTEYPLVKKVGNMFLNFATNFISGTKLKDTESGFRAFTIDALKKMYLISERYEIAVEIVFEVGRNNIKTANVNVSSPTYVKGVGVLDGVKNFLFLMRRRERSLGDYFTDFMYVMRNALRRK